MWRRLRTGVIIVLATMLVLAASLAGCMPDDDFAVRMSEVLEGLLQEGTDDEVAAFTEALGQILENPEAAVALPRLLGRPNTLGPPVAQAPEPFFRDDFRLPGIWFTAQEPGFSLAYHEAGYRIENRFPYTPVNSVRTLDHANVHLEVDATLLAGPASGTYGLVCRWQDVRNFYVLMIGGDGRALIGHVSDGYLRALADSEAPPDPSGTIYPAGETNRIAGTCSGNTLTLALNGEPLLEVENHSLVRGLVGLAVANHGEPGTVVRFDDFSLARP